MIKNKLLKLKENDFGLDSYDIDYEIDGKLYRGILISDIRLKHLEELNNEK